MLTAAGAIAAAYWFKRQAELPKRKLPEPWPEVSHNCRVSAQQQQLYWCWTIARFNGGCHNVRSCCHQLLVSLQRALVVLGVVQSAGRVGPFAR